MPHIGIIGAGNIGSTIYAYLKKKYKNIAIADQRTGNNIELVNFSNTKELTQFIADKDLIINAGPYHYNRNIVDICFHKNIAYFDLTEDVEVTNYIKSFDYQSALLAPQCGLAPGAINIIASDLASKLDEVYKLKLRVGALPRFVSNEMSYYLTWSTEGLINEYCNPCDTLYQGKLVKAQPLDGLENIFIDGIQYEAFNTSGGVATMCETYADKVQDLNYKTIRYPGHCEKMKFLLNDLNLKSNKKTFVDLFNQDVPYTTDDVVVIFVSAQGKIGDRLQELTYTQKVYGDSDYSAIQKTTAGGVCSIVNLYVDDKIQQTGFLNQENVSFADFTSNTYGSIYSI